MATTPYSPQSQGIAYAPPNNNNNTDSYPLQTKEEMTTVTTNPVHPQSPIHPQTAPVYPQQQHQHQHQHQHQQQQQFQNSGYVVRPGAMVPHAQHFTPPTGPTQDWQHGMCDCFDDWGICCIGMWAPCVLYSRTHKRIRTSPSTLRSFSCCNAVCWCNCCCGVGRFRQRDEVRYRYNLKGSLSGDFCRELYCWQCTLCQEEMEVRDREKQMAQMHSASAGAGGYAAPQGMTYARPPQ